MAMHLIVSNSAEKLAEHFRDEIYLKRTKEEIFVPETVIVQSQGMAVWLTQQLSDPIAANLDTPFLNSFADGILTRFFPDEAKPLMTEDRMFWQLFRILLSDLKDYPELSKYVMGENRNLKACQLAEKIAGLFDQYQIYHPELLKGWRDGTGESAGSWQAKLFMQISEGASGRDERFAALRTKNFTDEETASLPKRISLFGISVLAPVYFELFRKLGTVTEVYFYYMNPSLEYWSENIDLKSAARQRLHAGWKNLEQGKDPDDFQVGNPLLTSLGRQGQDFFRYLCAQNVLPDETDLFEELVPDGRKYHIGTAYRYDPCTMLGALQEDILLNIYRNPKSEEGDPGSDTPLSTPSDEPDGSIAIHSCHNDLRQVEILYDQLLNLIEKDRLQPRDILVMAPDIGRFEPYIQAVFGGQGSRLKNLFSIADRSKRLQNRCADTLLKALKLLCGKFEATAVFELFENEETAARWDFSPADLEELRGWVTSLKVHWGVDGADHERHCGVNFEEFSWKPALDRLILGYAVQERDREQWAEPVIPFDSAEGKEFIKTGKFIHFLQTFFEKQAVMRDPMPLSKWCDQLEDLLELLFKPCKRNYQELAALRATITLLRENGGQEGSGNALSEPLDLRLIMYFVEKMLVSKAVPEPFLRGKITFCSLMPMRSIPMPVIAILGLEEKNFPRQNHSVGFDVVSAIRRRVALERSRNAEDRYIFLEALLAARKHLLLFYQGKDEKTNDSLPPAVPLAEFKDALNATFPEAGSKCLTEHCLQAFDSRYFMGDSKLFSYSAENYEGAKTFMEFRNLAAEGNKEEGAPRTQYTRMDITKELRWEAGQEPETMQCTTPQKFEDFFQDPSQFYLETAIGLSKDYDRNDLLEDREDIFASWKLSSQILNHIQNGMKLDDGLYQLLRKTNSLPAGCAGKQAFESACSNTRQIPKNYLDRYMDTESRTVSVEIPELGFRIEGEIQVYSKNPHDLYMICMSANSTARTLISMRLRHLILNAAGEKVNVHLFDWNKRNNTVNSRSTVNSVPCKYLPAIEAEKAKEELKVLIGYYREGHRRPLLFFPKSSFTVPADPDRWKTTKGIQNGFKGTDYKDKGKGEYDSVPAIQLIYTRDVLNADSPYFDEFCEISSNFYRFIHQDLKIEQPEGEKHE